MAQARSLKAVFDLLIKTYQTDTALISWCNTNFGEQPEIQAGHDEDDIPQMTGKLAIRIIPGSRARTRGMSKRSHGLLIRGIIKHTLDRVPAIVDPEADPPLVQETDWRVLEAIELADSFINLVEVATILAIQKDSIAISSLDGAPDQIIYPYARVELAYTIEIPSDL